MVVKVYGYLKAACPQKVVLCFLEKGTEFEVIHVDLDTHEQKRPQHLLRQPFGQVPAIEDGDFKLYDILLLFLWLQESRAILRYYSTKYADQGTDLLGKTLEQRAICLRHIVNITSLSSMVTSRPNLNRWWNEISARRAWKKLMEMSAC